MKVSSTNLVFFYRWLLIFPIAAILSSCGAGFSFFQRDQVKMAPMAGMPVEVQQAPASVSDAYRFAVANPDALKNVPCYCGCGKIGHTSNYSCYVKEAKPSGEVVFDQHAVFCSVCVNITQDVMKMTGDGKSPQEIRKAIDLTYSQLGPSYMEPTP